MTDLAVPGMAHRGAGFAMPAAPDRLGRDYSSEVLAGPDAYQALRADCERLAGAQAETSFFQAPDLLAVWSRHFTDAGTTQTLVIRRAGRPVLIWPLALKRRAGLRVLTAAGAPVTQYSEILLDPAEDGRALVQAALDILRRDLRPDVLALRTVRADSPLRAVLGDVVTGSEGAPFSDLKDGVDAFMVTLKSRVTKQQAKRVKRFEQEGAVAFEVAADPGEAEAWIKEAIRLKRDWLAETGRLSRAFVKPEMAECLEELARALTRPDASPRMVTSRLTLDGRTAAIEMGLCRSGAYHLYLGAFVPEFAKFGPGNILTQRVLEWCVANGISRYDMMAPRSRNKAEWQSAEIEVFDIAAPMSARGRFYTEVVLRRLIPGLRSLFYRLPAPLRSALSARTLRPGQPAPQPAEAEG